MSEWISRPRLVPLLPAQATERGRPAPLEVLFLRGFLVVDLVLQRKHRQVLP